MARRASATDAEGWPDFLTVEQAAFILGIGRTTAYALVGRYLDSDGAEGVRAIRLGKQLRVPRTGLEVLLGGPLTPPATPRPPASTAAASSPVTMLRSHRGRPLRQSTLPFEA